jgi:hypothetical protein
MPIKFDDILNSFEFVSFGGGNEAFVAGGRARSFGVPSQAIWTVWNKSCRIMSKRTTTTSPSQASTTST